MGSAPLLGRERELDELRDALAAALGGRGEFCLLAGEPGMGKTSLATALAELAEAEGATPVWGRAWEAGGAPAFWPWVQVIRRLSRGRDGDRLRELMGAGAPWIAQIAPELRELVPEIEGPRELDTPQARFSLFDAIAAYLRGVSEERPLTILFDDFHAADPPSLLMLEFAARGLRDAPICIVAAYQEAAARARPEIADLVADLGRQARRVVLGRLGEDDIRSLVERQAGVLPEPELVGELHGATEGNPFFINEVVRLLASEGRLTGADVGPATARIAMPSSIRDAVRQRVEPLGADGVEILALAAVSGREFRLSALQRAAGVGTEELVETIDRATAAGVIGPDGGPGIFRFTHGLIRETLYGDLRTAKRVQAHGVIGDALAELYSADEEPHLAELAHHFLQAAPGGWAAKAVDYAARAGERAMRLLAYEEADRLFAGALAALELLDPDPGRRAELLLALGRAQVRAGDPAARDTLLAAAGAARSLDRADLLAAAALAFRAFSRYPGVVDEEVAALLQEALERVGDADERLRARLLVRLAVQLIYSVEEERRESLIEEAVALARRIGDASTLAYVLVNAQLARWRPDRRDEALEYGAEALQLAQVQGDTELALTMHNRQADLLLELDDIGGADVEIAALERLAERVADPRAHGHAALQRARRAAMDGRFEESERLSAEAYALGERARDPAIPYVARGQQWSRHWGRGTLSELEALTKSVADAAPGLVVWRAALARVYHENGRESEARREFERLVGPDGVNVPPNDNWLPAMVILSEVCVLLGDAEHAETLLRTLEPYAGRNAVSLHGGYFGPIDRSIGILAALTGDRERADRHLAAAFESAERMHARPAMAIIRLDQATVMLGAGEAGGARELIDEAAAIAADVGADGLTRRAEELRERVPGDAKAPRAGPRESLDAVLRREGDVWVFDYDGRSVRVKDTKGLAHLAQLLSNPGVELHALDLVEISPERQRAAAAGGGLAALSRPRPSS